MHLYLVEFQWFSTRDNERHSGSGGCYDCETQEGEAPFRRCSRPEIMWSTKPLTPHDYGLDLWQAIPGVTEMAVAKQQLSYQCDQCGSPNIVALPVLHEQGTRTYSSPTNWGSSQSYSAQGAAPPRRKGYGGPFLLWGFLLSFFLFWSWACYSAMLKYPKTASSMEYPLGLLGLMVLGCVIGLVLTSRKVSRYNQAVFPVLYSTWARTYMCRRCGKLLHIPS
jgi:DNA-directed RNA polymerase subunit RPC12/RpoP